MKRKMLSFALSLGLALTLAATDQLPKPQSKDALKKMEKADKAIQKNDFNSALALYNEVITLEPDYAPVYFTSARLNRMMGNFELAIANFEKALQLKADFTLALNDYIRTLLTLSQKAVEGRDLKKAVSYYEKIVNHKNIEATHPKELQHAAYQLGSVAYSLQDFKKSIEAFQRFLAIPEIEMTAPVNSALANYILGINYSRLNQPDKAIPCLEKFIAAPQNESTTPWLPTSHYLLANNHYLILEKQIAQLKDDKSSDALASLENITAAAKANTAIQPNFSKAIELKPDLEEAYLKLGRYYFFCQDFDNALKTYNELITKFPTSPDMADYKSFMQNIEKERETIKKLQRKKKTK
ncbi:MAG: tetratricopeptide repeat protein [Candidatus Aminicenantes bacterium]|nr:tetratricopeptide repeat protein [Candidatus Aminicenantes bacterium]